jgi:hypothetical protein
LSDNTYDAVYIGIKGKLATVALSPSQPAVATDPVAMDEETKAIIAQYGLALAKP